MKHIVQITAMAREDICRMDCNFKQILESSHESVEFYAATLAQCALCIHSEKKDCFTPRQEVVAPTSTWGKLLKAFKEHCIRGSG